MSTLVKYHVEGWLKEPRAEGPITPNDAVRLLEAFYWDGDYARAHALAGDLSHDFTGDAGVYSAMEFGRMLGVRSVLYAVMAKQERERDARAARRRARR